MKGYVLGILLIGAFLMLVAPPGALAQDKPNYFAVKAGAYFPTGDLDDNDFDTGFNGELAYGYYFNPNFALEGGIGWFETDADERETVFVPSVGFVTVSIDADVTVVPITVTAKGVIPTGQVELYGGVGAGIYFADVEVDGRALGVSVSDDDDDTVIGGHLMAGLSVDISPAVFVGIEGKYIFTDEADFFGGETDLNGFTLTGNLGFRF